VVHNPPLWTLSDEGEGAYREVLPEIVALLNLDGMTRLDVSPNQGGITEALSLYSDASIINIYGFNASLFHAMWGYQSNVFYSPGMGTTHELNQLAQWFGVKYVILHAELYPRQIYPDDLWPVVYPPGGASAQGIMVREYNDAPEMASLLATPTILVISGYENAIYEQVFKTFTKGALDFDGGLSIEGTHWIDDYRIEDLRRFDAVFLHGYGYADREAAWELLATYVAEGGALFVDTGWQFFSPDWETADAPAVMPVQALEWTDFGMTGDYLIVDPTVAAGVDASRFAPLIWENLPWGVSAPLGGLREWARPVVTVGGRPIVAAGEYGAGRVVWSGMNLVGHSLANDNLSERQLLGALVAWLAPPPGTFYPDPEVFRDHPDHLRLVLDGPTHAPASLLWREAYSPHWHARLIADGREESIPIYRAGPGLMLLMLPQIAASGAEIRLDYNVGWMGTVGAALSLTTLVLLLIRAFKPDFGQGLAGGIRGRRSKGAPRGEVSWMPGLDSPPANGPAPLSRRDFSPVNEILRPPRKGERVM
jgi:hypothetical protein